MFRSRKTKSSSARISAAVLLLWTIGACPAYGQLVAAWDVDILPPTGTGDSHTADADFGTNNYTEHFSTGVGLHTVLYIDTATHANSGRHSPRRPAESKQVVTFTGTISLGSSEDLVLDYMQNIGVSNANTLTSRDKRVYSHLQLTIFHGDTKLFDSGPTFNEDVAHNRGWGPLDFNHGGSSFRPIVLYTGTLGPGDFFTVQGSYVSDSYTPGSIFTGSGASISSEFIVDFASFVPAVAAVPEPSTLLLMASGIGMFGIWLPMRRRKRSKCQRG